MDSRLKKVIKKKKRKKSALTNSQETGSLFKSYCMKLKYKDFELEISKRVLVVILIMLF